MLELTGTGTLKTEMEDESKDCFKKRGDNCKKHDHTIDDVLCQRCH